MPKATEPSPDNRHLASADAPARASAELAGPPAGSEAAIPWQSALFGASLAYVAVGLLETVKVYLFRHLQGIGRNFAFVSLEIMPWWSLWLPILPAVLWVSRRFRFAEGHWKLSSTVHFVAAFGLSTAHVVVFSAVFMVFFPDSVVIQPSLPEQIRYFLGRYLFTDFLTYCATVAVYLAFDNFVRYRRTAIAAAQNAARAAQLRLSLSEARMQALRMELNPHFLFNTLNAVAGLVRRREHDAAIETLSQLGELLRTTLNREMPTEVTLLDELALLDRFLGIERVRFGERLQVTHEIDEDAYEALVPPLILQPIVENAVKHGVARRTGPAFLEISARRIDDGARLELSVRDSGEGLSARHGRPPREGVGLSNIKARLEELYGHGSYRVELRDEPGGGARTIVVLPWHAGNGTQMVAASA